ncbi:peptide chain release factor 3 [Jatrophihabitans sp. YIM 134969]
MLQDAPARTSTDDTVISEARRRRTFAVISHPDAGKSTLTEALVLHASAISSAGAVHGKGGRRGVTSDFLAMEQARGISITSAVMQFSFRDAVINLLDTPGHADFSEDTYRVLTAVDSAIMLLDAAKGLEPQTLRLFDVCRARGVPVITFVNKWDRPGREPYELLDEIEQRIGLKPMPLTWPVGEAGDFRGVVDVDEGRYHRYTRAEGGAAAATDEVLTLAEAAEAEPDTWPQAADELELLDAIGAGFDDAAYRSGKATPVLFGAALTNFGVGRLLDAVVDLAPAPAPRSAGIDESPRPLDAPFAAQVFKVQAGTNKAHRDRTAYIRIWSGRFERGEPVVHAGTGKPMVTKYAHTSFGQDRHTADLAFPGDVVGLVNANGLRVGDTLYAADPVTYPPLTLFAPEHFAVIEATDRSRSKQFRRGIVQLAEEGAIQLLHSERRGEHAPVLGAVGQMQFEVVTARLEGEYGAATRLTHLPYTVVREIAAEDAPLFSSRSDSEALVNVVDGRHLAVFVASWDLRAFANLNPDVVLTPLVASGEA